GHGSVFADADDELPSREGRRGGRRGELLDLGTELLADLQPDRVAAPVRERSDLAPLTGGIEVGRAGDAGLGLRPEAHEEVVEDIPVREVRIDEAAGAASGEDVARLDSRLREELVEQHGALEVVGGTALEHLAQRTDLRLPPAREGQVAREVV